MKKALISRFGAFGDHIHCSHIPRLLKENEGFDVVDFQYNFKGIPIYANNPFIDKHIQFEPTMRPICDYPVSFIQKRLNYIAESGKYDRVIDLQNSIERGYMAMENMNEYYRDSAYRRKKYGQLNYYDVSTIAAGYPQYIGMVGDLHFTEYEEKFVKDLYERLYKDKFVIVLNLSGSSKQKLFLDAEKVITQFLSTHKDAVCITVGDEDCRKLLEFKGERIINRSGFFNEDKSIDKDGNEGYPFRQSMMMAKFANLCMGYESGLMVASTLLGTPTLQLMTAASIKNHGGDFPNDYSLQSPIYCSPCHKGPYSFIGCPKIDVLDEKYPACIKFNPEAILMRMERVYQETFGGCI